MLDNLDALLDKVTGPLDLAIVLIAGTTGFVVDAGLNAVGFLEPGAVGIGAATGALGVKKAIEAALIRGKAVSNAEKQMARAERLIEILHGSVVAYGSSHMGHMGMPPR